MMSLGLFWVIRGTRRRGHRFDVLAHPATIAAQTPPLTWEFTEQETVTRQREWPFLQLARCESWSASGCLSIRYSDGYFIEVGA
jgi:hypothetical protein